MGAMIQLPPSDSSRVYLSRGAESLGAQINVGSPAQNGQFDDVRQHITGLRAAWQERCLGTSNACGVPGHLEQDGQGQHPVRAAVAGAPGDRANTAMQK